MAQSRKASMANIAAGASNILASKDQYYQTFASKATGSINVLVNQGDKLSKPI
jgi:hypothetical protein